MTRDHESLEPPRRARGRPPREPGARAGDPGVIGGPAAENLSHAILDSLPALVVVIEPDGRIIAVNKAWEQFSQDAADEVPAAPGLGGNYLDALEDRTSFEAAVADEALAGLHQVLDRQRGRFELEYPLDLRGERRFFLLSVTPLLGADGGAAISHVETTGRRRAEQGTADQHRLLQAMLESTADGVVVADMAGEFRLFNRAAREIAGVGIVKDDPAKWSENYGIFHPDRVTMMKLEELPLYRAIRGESTDKVRMFLKNPAIPGGRFIEISGRPWTTPEGERLGGVVGFTDVTAQVLAEEQSSFQLQVLDAVPLAVLALDPAGKVVYWNAAAEQLFGWSAAELVGRRGRDVLLDEAQRAQADAIRDSILSDRPYRGEFKVQKPDGTRVPVLASATARWRSDGTLDGFVVVGVDLTDVHMTPQALRVREPATLLLVEDDSGVRTIERRLLELAGHLVLEAGEGDAALDLVRAYTGPIDLVVCDVVLPGRNGREVVEALRHLRPGLRALFVSGHSPEMAARMGAPTDEPFLQKPFSAAELQGAVKKAMTDPPPEAR